MRSYPVKEKHIGSAVSNILRNTQTSCYFIIRKYNYFTWLLQYINPSFFSGPIILHPHPAWTASPPGPPVGKTPRQVPPPKQIRNSALSAKQPVSEIFPKLIGKAKRGEGTLDYKLYQYPKFYEYVDWLVQTFI